MLEHFRRRLAAADASVARFVIKGVTSHHKKHKGRFPAIAEEVMLTLAQNKPVYIAGAFDGAAAILGSLLGLAHPRRGDVARSLQAKPAHKEKSLQAIARELQPGPWTDLPITAEELIPFLKLYALGGSKWPNNGLTFEENRELFACRFTRSSHDMARSRAAKLLTLDEARRIAVNIAKLPELLKP